MQGMHELLIIINTVYEIDSAFDFTSHIVQHVIAKHNIHVMIITEAIKQMADG
jgi:hypothetical protein